MANRERNPGKIQNILHPRDNLKNEFLFSENWTVIYADFDSLSSTRGFKLSKSDFKVQNAGSRTQNIKTEIGNVKSERLQINFVTD